MQDPIATVGLRGLIVNVSAGSFHGRAFDCLILPSCQTAAALYCAAEIAGMDVRTRAPNRAACLMEAQKPCKLSKAPRSAIVYAIDALSGAGELLSNSQGVNP